MIIPQGGFNDCLVSILKAINYCKNNNRILLINMKNTTYSYKINFSDYFDFEDNNIIYNYNIIEQIIKKKEYSVYPNCLNNKLVDILNDKLKFYYEFKDDGRPNNYYYNNTLLYYLPKNNVNEDIIIFSGCGGGNGFDLFKQLIFKDNIKHHCTQKLKILQDINYLCIQVRNTDAKTDYISFYNSNKDLIHSFKNIYVATDDISVVDYFKSKKLNIFNFCTFPEKPSENLHYSNVNEDIKIKDLICDIFIATNSNKLLSNSTGGYIKLMKDCFENKNIIINKILLTI